MCTECKDCKFREGDCGHHFLFNGVVNYDIPSLSACDQCGNCMFFERMAESKGDLISREALKKAIDNYAEKRGDMLVWEQDVLEIIDNAPTEERPHGEWKLHGMIYYCSECGHDYEQGGNNFCGNCGADMRSKS